MFHYYLDKKYIKNSSSFNFWNRLLKFHDFLETPWAKETLFNINYVVENTHEHENDTCDNVVAILSLDKNLFDKKKIYINFGQ